MPGYGLGVILAGIDWPLIIVSLLSITVSLAMMSASGMKLGNLLGRDGRLVAARSLAHGSARWMAMADARAIFRDGSLVVGEACLPTDAPVTGSRAPLLRFDGSGHLLTVAGSGGGKSVSVAIPNCLSWEGNMVVHDPKGELAHLCRRARQDKGRRVVVFDPNSRETDTVNVLDWLDPSTDQVIEHANAVVAWLGNGEEPKGENAFFDRSASRLIHLLILFVVCDPDRQEKDRTLETVRQLVASPELVRLLADISEQGQLAFGVPAQFAGELYALAKDSSRTFASVRGVASEMTAWLSIPSLSRLVCGTGLGRHVRVADIIHGDLDVFICIPLRTLDSTPAAARLLFGAFLNAIYGNYEKTRSFERRTLFLIDEMPRLRKLDLLETARDAGRGLGVTLWSIIQDLGQLEKHYGKEGLRGWMESSQVKTFFGIGDHETAEMISKMMDQMTVETTSKGSSSGLGWSPTQIFSTSNNGHTVNTQLLGRRLMTPGEIMTMATDADGVPDEQIVFMRNRPPLRCGMAKWYRRSEWSALVDSTSKPVPFTKVA